MHADAGRMLVFSTGMQDMGEWILDDPTVTNRMECAEYVAAATAGAGNVGLFAHDSEHTSLQIMTPLGKIRLNHGRLHQLAVRDPTNRFDIPEHLTWQMNLAIDQNEIDASVSSGVLGETLIPTLDNKGKPIMHGMGSIRGSEDDCEWSKCQRMSAQQQLTLTFDSHITFRSLYLGGRSQPRPEWESEPAL